MEVLYRAANREDNRQPKAAQGNLCFSSTMWMKLPVMMRKILLSYVESGTHHLAVERLQISFQSDALSGHKAHASFFLSFFPDLIVFGLLSPGYDVQERETENR